MNAEINLEVRQTLENHLNVFSLQSPYQQIYKEEFKYLGIDSIKLVNLVTNVCMTLDVDLLSFSDDEILALKTLHDLEILLNNKRNGI